MESRGGYGTRIPDSPGRFPFPVFLILAFLLGGLILASMSNAEVDTCGLFYTVTPGDDLSRIASLCGTSVAALLEANPNISLGEPLEPGQILTIPETTILVNNSPENETLEDNIFEAGFIPDTGSIGGTYTVVKGDTLSTIAVRHGISLSSLIQANPQIANPALIHPGQVLTIPGPASPPPPEAVIPDTGSTDVVYTVQRGDTLSEIARRYGISTANLIQRNPQITNPNLIYPGQQVVISDDLPPPTALPTQQLTPTIVFPTPAPTLPASAAAPPDIIPDTGATLHHENFSVPGDWFTAVENNFRMEYAEEGYRILNKSPNSFVTSTRAIELTDIHVDTEAAWVGGPQTGMFGVVCRWQDINNYYAFVIGSDGFYGIARVLTGQLTFLGEGRTTNGPILLGLATNTIGGSCTGDRLTLSVNGYVLIEVQDQSFGTGYPGLVVGTRSTSGTHVQFNEFQLRQVAALSREVLYFPAVFSP